METNLELLFKLDPHAAFDQDPEWVFQYDIDWVVENEYNWILENKSLNDEMLDEYYDRHNVIPRI